MKRPDPIVASSLVAATATLFFLFERPAPAPAPVRAVVPRYALSLNPFRDFPRMSTTTTPRLRVLEAVEKIANAATAIERIDLGLGESRPGTVSAAKEAQEAEAELDAARAELVALLEELGL